MISTRRTGTWRAGILPALVGLLLISTTGCQTPGGATTRPALVPTVDRITAAYDDLDSKRFQVIADFETAEQGSLFRMEPAGAGTVAVSTERARTDTGVGALKISLASSAQKVVASDSPEAKWALLRDWSPYQLLLVSVFSPRKLGGFTVSVASGTGSPLVYTHSRVFLNSGWNLVRIDLGEMAEQINLADVRAVRFWCNPLESPIDLYLDDIILVDNSRDVLGSRNSEPGDLYVRAEGRRIAVGAAGRFELVFSRGQLRQWFDLGNDPGRSHNLAGPGDLGPTPVVLSADAKASVAIDDPSQWSGLGATAEVSQSLLEANPLRVLLQGERRFISPDGTAGESGPAHRWFYSVYPDGRVYIECSGTARAGALQPPAIGMVFCCDGSFGFKPPSIEPPPSKRGAGPYALFSRDQRGQADLLVVPFSSLQGRRLRGGQDARQCVLWSMPLTADTFSFAAMLRLWPADIDTPRQAGPFAADYHQPLPVSVDAGRLVKTDPGDWDNDGFSEARGYYVLQLDGSVAKLRIDGRQTLRFSPLFKLVDVLDRDVWIYINGRLVTSPQRDREGNILFHAPGVIDQETLVEITSRVRQPASSPS